MFLKLPHFYISYYNNLCVCVLLHARERVYFFFARYVLRYYVLFQQQIETSTRNDGNTGKIT